VYEGHVLISVIGAFFSLVISLVAAIKTGFAPTIISPASNPGLFYTGIVALLFVPFLIGMYFMWDEKTTVDGANDNLSGCYMGIAILKALKDEGIELEHTEVGVILSGSEEAGLRGAKAWCEQHKGEFDDVPTWIFSYDTIHDSKFLMVNYRDLNGTVKSDKEVGDMFYDTATEMNIKCNKGMVPPFGGATDSAAFAQAGMKSTGITALNHVLEDYYHTLRDTADNMDEGCLADCFAISVKCLEKFDAMHK
ncbi:M20/M25/M40 family metallo-hydrolase, partial [bacterium]|nr:M20/M25/M40 family metallo-hydrolase [bacterium]